MFSIAIAMEDWNYNSNRGWTFEKVDSPAISILSASGTLVPSNPREYSQPPHPLSRSSTIQTLVATSQESSLPFDPQLFKTILRSLNENLERFEALNDQILEAMTKYDEFSLGMADTALPSSSTNSSPFSIIGQDKEEERPGDLERDRRFIAKSISDVILSSWPSLCNPIATTSATQTQSQTGKMNKQRIKIAIQIKQIIASLWSAQSLFQEKAQIILDIFQDLTELQNQDRIRTLRSSHLNNLLSNPHSPIEGDRLEQKFKSDQDKLVNIMGKLQDIWLETVLTLPGNSTKSGETSDSVDTPESFGRKLLRVSKSKRQAFK
ncbi:hypothetical protein BGZ49_004669, partial [Haplosporangium sp. Z 27]